MTTLNVPGTQSTLEIDEDALRDLPPPPAPPAELQEKENFGKPTLEGSTPNE